MARFPGRGARVSQGSKRANPRTQGRSGLVAPLKPKYKSTRLEELGDHVSPEADEHSLDDDLPDGLESRESSPASEESDQLEGQPHQPYSELLQMLNAQSELKTPSSKRRKLSHNGLKQAERDILFPLPKTTEDGSSHLESTGAIQGPNEDLNEESEVVVEEEIDDDNEDGNDDVSDPFEVHFANPDENELSRKVQAKSENSWQHKKDELGGGYRIQLEHPDLHGGDFQSYPPGASLKPVKLKHKLAATTARVMSDFDPLQRSLIPYMFNYSDILFGGRAPKNSESLRNAVCLHALNHVYKTRDRVIKNNGRLARLQDGVDLEIRDQGFTRPKILFLLPTRQSCVKVVEVITKLCDPEQQENKKRFMDSFSQDQDKSWRDKPEDFQELFGGNDDDMFRLGLKFTRKTIKYFSQFYNADIILASPLGLRTAMEKSEGGKQDHDYLSSIEIAIVDQAGALLMQNWEHVEYIFSYMNKQPKEAHGCDFSRVRTWYLDGQAKHLRQTIVLSAFITPELNTMFSRDMRNVAGRVKISPTYPGSMLNLSTPMPIKQTFSRFDSPTPLEDPNRRFKYFTTTVIPSLTRGSTKARNAATGTVIFIPSYLDFVRLRNYLTASNQTTNLSFGVISEYASVRDVARARSHFLSGRHAVLLYTERAHHFRRYQIKGVKKVVMYGLPENSIFYPEIAGFLGLGTETGDTNIRAVFSKYDALKLERVVGTQRVGSMLREKGGDTFDFM